MKALKSFQKHLYILIILSIILSTITLSLIKNEVIYMVYNTNLKKFMILRRIGFTPLTTVD